MVLGTFIDRIETVDVVQDPLGGELEFPRIEFRNVEFRVSTEYPQLEVTNPPRNFSGFLTRLGEHLQFSTPITSVEADPLQWLDQIEKEIGRVSVLAIALSDISITRTISAKVCLTGTDDVRPQIDKIVSAGRSYRTDRVEFHSKNQPLQFAAEICQGGRACLTRGAPEFTETLRAALMTLHSG